MSGFNFRQYAHKAWKALNKPIRFGHSKAPEPKVIECPDPVMTQPKRRASNDWWLRRSAVRGHATHRYLRARQHNMRAQL